MAGGKINQRWFLRHRHRSILKPLRSGAAIYLDSDVSLLKQSSAECRASWRKTGLFGLVKPRAIRIFNVKLSSLAALNGVSFQRALCAAQAHVQGHTGRSRRHTRIPRIDGWTPENVIPNVISGVSLFFY